MITNHDEWQRWNVLSSAEWWGSVCWYGTRLEASYLIWKWYHWTAFLITSHRSRNLTGSANILFYTPCHLPTLLHLLLKALQRLICFSWIVTDCCQNILAKFFQANVMFNYRGSQFITVSVCSSPSSNTFEWSWVVSTILEWTYKSYIRDAFYVRWNLFISQFTQMAISFK